MSYLEIINKKIFIVFSIVLFLNLLILNYRYKIAKYIKIIDLQNDRKIHKVPTPLTGIGYFLTITILLFYIFFKNQVIWKIYLFNYYIYRFFLLTDDIKTLCKIKIFFNYHIINYFNYFWLDFIIHNLNFKSFNSSYNFFYSYLQFSVFLRYINKILLMAIMD